MDTMLPAKLLPGRRASAEGVALGRGSFSTQGMQIAEGKSIGRAKSSCMVLTSGRHKEIIGQAPRHRTQGPNTTGPGMEKVRDHHHAQRATLRNATGVVVSGPEPPSNGIIIAAAGMKGAVGQKGTRGEPTQAT